MKEQWEQECMALKAEVAALQQQVRALAAQHASDKTFSGWRVSKGLKLVLLPVFMLLAAGGVLYGQGAMDALFIDKDGKVGIGETNPGEKLQVTGGKIQLDGNQQIKFTDADTTNNLKLQLWSGYGLGINGGTLFYAANGKHSWRDNGGANERMALTTGADGGLTVLGTGTSSFAGSVGIGAPVPNSKLDVRGRALVQSLSFTDENGQPYADNWIGMADNVLDDKTKWLHIGGITDGADNNKQRRIALYANTTYIDGNVGIWTKKPEARLDVNGDIKAMSINGEKPPLVFEVGQKNDTTNWHHVEQDIGALCGDADGCTMKFFLRHSLNDEVRTISEQIYIEQPDKSSNKSPGLLGWTKQLDGANHQFRLQTAEKHDIVPHPWEWIYVRNYTSGEVGPESNAYSGYQVQFMTHPHVTATVIIYDR